MTSATPAPDPSPIPTPTPTLGPAPGPSPPATPSPAATPTPSTTPAPATTPSAQPSTTPSTPDSATPSSEATPSSAAPTSEATPTSTSETTSAPASEPDATRPTEPDTAALYDAMVTEHATIYGYGIVSAHSTPEDNDLVAQAMAAHRQQREALLTMLEKRSVAVPLTAPGYQLPSKVDDPTDAANLAVRMENDSATAYRAVLEQATSDEDRVFAVAALTQSAVFAARWKQILEIWPVTEAFPGGSE